MKLFYYRNADQYVLIEYNADSKICGQSFLTYDEALAFMAEGHKAEVI